MKILLLSKYSKLGASTRLRTMQFIPHLEVAGISVVQQSLFDDSYLKKTYAKQRVPLFLLAKLFFERLLTILKANSYDLVWIEYEIIPYFPAWFEKLFNLLGVKYVVDYDDAIFHNYDLSKSKIIRITLGRKIDKVMNNATAVIVGNDYLASRAQKANADNIVYIPTVVDIDRYRVKKFTVNDRPVIGWIGSPSTQKYITQFFNVFKRLSEKYDFVLRLVGAREDIISSLPGINVEVLAWTEELEARYIESFDVGIMPLNDGPWERGKCGYKLIQYMACGIPVVASPVGVNSTIVNNNNCGFLAENDSDFYRYLEMLFNDDKLRKDMGISGRDAVDKHYSLQSQSKNLTHLFNSIVEKNI